MSDNTNINETKVKDLLENFYKKIESKIKDISDKIKDNIIPDTEEKLRKNVFISILISFSVGLIIGIFVMLFGFLRGKKK